MFPFLCNFKKKDGRFFSNFVSFLQYLNFKEVIDAAYDVPSIARDLDWIAVMSYDYHGSWNKKTGHVSPMYDHPDNRYDSYNTVNISFFTCRVIRMY